jgi:lysosomal alpha-glucosidase
VPPELTASNAPWCHFPTTPATYVAEALAPAAGGASAALRRVALGAGEGRDGRGPFGQDPPALTAELAFYAADAFRLRVRDPASPPRWSPPRTLPLTPGLAAMEGASAAPPPEGRRYAVALSAPAPAPFSLRVTRSKDARVALEALGADLLFEPQLVQFSVTLPLGTLIHGLGEAVAPWELGHLAAGSAGTGGSHTHTLWTRDRGTPDAGPNGNANLYGAHPFVLLRDAADGATTGLFLRSTAAMDVTVGPAAGGGGGGVGAQALTFRVAGGDIDLFVFVGEGPDEVLAGYHALVGLPALPPLWGLGFHVCRWGYPSLGAAAAVRADLNAAGFPLDTLWLDIDYMNAYRDFTLSEHFPEAEVRKWVDELHAEGQRFVVINDPGIASGYPRGEYAPFDEGVAADVFIKAPPGSPETYAIGGVWPGATAFADFSAPTAHAWWEAQIAAFHKKIGFDGLWLDMGEPSVFRDALEEARARRAAAPSPPPPAPLPPPVTAGAAARAAREPLMDLTWAPFLPGRRGGAAMLEEKTLPTAARTAAGPQYWVHSLFGLLEAAATAPVLRRLTGSRQFIISRATWAGSGAFGGHWLGDNTATWHDLRMSMPGVFNFHVFGQPFVGTDLCGFAPAGASVGGHAGMGGEGALDDHGLDGELCARWYQMGALVYTFFRVRGCAPH